jgi:RNA polymerase sigma factor (TIGR02999 family)
MATSSGEVTRLLDAMRADDGDEAFGELFGLVYDELHRQAHRQRAGWYNARTLNTTALVHEAYAKLVDGADVPFESRAHLLAVAAKAMRHILLDYVKARQAQKRGGDRDRVTLDAGLAVSEEETTQLLALEQALERLQEMSAEAARIVECRFFGGMSVEETAEALGVSASTVKRRWRMARAWLHRELTAIPPLEE